MSALKDENTVDDIAKRFILAIDMFGYTAYRLAKEVDGITQQTMTHLRSGRNAPSTKVISALLKKFPSLNVHWLFTGEGDPLIMPEISNNIEKTSYKHILHDIPVDEIINYIQEHEVARGFRKSNTYNLFLEIHTQRKLIEKMNDLETRIHKLSNTKEDNGQ